MQVSSPRLDAVTGIVAKRYQIINELGRGGMGVVYRVRHCFTGEKLALKVLNDSLVKQERQVSMRDRKRKSEPTTSMGGDPTESPWTARFKREMQISAKVGSEHVVRITDADVAPELGGSLFYVMELLRGSDLDHLLQEREKFSAEEVVWILYQLARGLDKAHKAGIVHRDLKPANLFIHKKNEHELILKILDFGLAFLVTDGPKADSPDKLTKTGATLGTLNYFAPEQAMGIREKIAPPTDVWAIGTIVYELLTGQCYFPGNDHTVAVKIARGELKSPSLRVRSLTRAFDDWFYKSCALDPENRFTSVAEQALKLAQALDIPDDVRRKLEDGDAPQTLLQWAQEQPPTGENDLPPSQSPLVDPLGATGMEVSADPRSAARPVVSKISQVGGTTDSAPPVNRLTPFQFAMIIAAFAVVAVLALIPISMMRRSNKPDQPTPTVKSVPTLETPQVAVQPTGDTQKAKSETSKETTTPAPVVTPPKNDDDESAKPSGRNKKKHRGKKGAHGKNEKQGVFDPEAP